VPRRTLRVVRPPLPSGMRSRGCPGLGFVGAERRLEERRFAHTAAPSLFCVSAFTFTEAAPTASRNGYGSIPTVPWQRQSGTSVRPTRESLSELSWRNTTFTERINVDHLRLTASGMHSGCDSPACP
jgi:hypothetical protein